jgi:cobalt-precorrin-5B (C1)-methyltransferase
MATLRAQQPALPTACFVQMGDFLRYALDEAAAQGIGLVVLAVMVGKLTKIAQGETITHANRSEVDTDLVAEIARRIGATAEDCAAIAAAETARFGAELMVERGLSAPFHAALAQAAIDTLTAPERYGRAFRLRVLVCDFEGRQVADVWSAPALPREPSGGAIRIGIEHILDID